MADLDLISVLSPFDYVCKQSDAAKSEGKYRTVRIYDIKLNTKEGKKLLRRLEERTRQGKDQEGAELRPLVQRYIERLREEESGTFGDISAPLQKFEEIADNLLRKDSARFSFATTKNSKDVCFIALVSKLLEESKMTIHFLQDGVKVQENAGAVPGGEEEGAVGGAPEGQRHGIATLVLPREWRSSFQRHLEDNIHLCHGHIGPALEALRLGHNSYTDSEGKTCRFNSSRSKRTLVQGMKKFPDKMSYKLYDKNPQLGSKICKVHLNGDGSDCLLVYVAQNYKQLGRVLLLVGVLTHHECGVKTGAKKKERATKKGPLDITEDMKAADKYLEK